jgi:hypothetical protein
MKRAPEGGLERSRRTHGLVALVVAGVVVASVPVAAPAADPASTPSPKELWDSYPLAPGGADPAPTPTPTPTPTVTPTASAAAERPPAAESTDHTETTAIAGGVLIAFAIGIGAGELWRRRRRAATALVAPELRPTAATVASRTEPAAPARKRPEPPPPARTRPEPKAAPPDREPEPAEWLAPKAPTPRPARRFVPTWPEDAPRHWTCEIEWKAGYRTSSFRAVAGPPAAPRRRALGDSPAGRWTLMADPDPPTRELMESVRALSDALAAAGWEEAGRGNHWYALRFIWRHTDEPRPIEPLTRKAKHV